jgi:3,2-trans-enoyl-CoA isomerase
MCSPLATTSTSQCSSLHNLKQHCSIAHPLILSFFFCCPPFPPALVFGCGCRLYAPSTSRARYLEFWRAQTVFLSRLYRSHLVTIALIRGSCPAGGCITALCCDYRVINTENNPTMGLNEVALGIPVPAYWARVMTCTIGQRATERILARGQLIDCQQARELGLVDEVVERERLMERCEAEMMARLKFPDSGRVTTKLQMREALAKEWEGQWEKEATEGWAMLSHESTIAYLGQVLQRLSGGKNRAAKGAGAAQAGQQTGSSQQQKQANSKL